MHRTPETEQAERQRERARRCDVGTFFDARWTAMFSREGLGLLRVQASKDRVLHISNSVSNSIFDIHARTMDATAVGGELVEYSK